MEDVFDVPGVVTVVPARMGARRLPGKVLLPLGDATVLGQVVRRIRASGLTGRVVVAIPEGDADKPLEEWCTANEIDCYIGSRDDVVGRVLAASLAFEAAFVVCCPANRPLIEPRMLWASARYASDSGMDFVSVARLPQGASADAMPIRTLHSAAKLPVGAGRRDDFNAATGDNPEIFERAMLPPPPRFARPDLRFTLETSDDYALLCRIYDHVPAAENGTISLDDAIVYVDANPRLLLQGNHSHAIVRAA